MSQMRFHLVHLNTIAALPMDVAVVMSRQATFIIVSGRILFFSITVSNMNRDGMMALQLVKEDTKPLGDFNDASSSL